MRARKENNLDWNRFLLQSYIFTFVNNGNSEYEISTQSCLEHRERFILYILQWGWKNWFLLHLSSYLARIDYGIQLMPSISFLSKIGDIGMFVYKIKLFVVIWIVTAYNEQDVTICKQP